MCKVRMHRMANGFLHVVWPRLLGGWILRKSCGKALSDVCLAHNYVLNQNKVLEKSQKHLDQALHAAREDLEESEALLASVEAERDHYSDLLNEIRAECGGMLAYVAMPGHVRELHEEIDRRAEDEKLAAKMQAAAIERVREQAKRHREDK